MGKDIRNRETDRLMDGILSLKNREEAYRFFEDLCTVPELQAMSQRLHVARLLGERQVYSDIVKETGASTATISRVNRCLSYGADGYQTVLARLDENRME